MFFTIVAQPALNPTSSSPHETPHWAKMGRMAALNPAPRHSSGPTSQ